MSGYQFCSKFNRAIFSQDYDGSAVFKVKLDKNIKSGKYLDTVDMDLLINNKLISSLAFTPGTKGFGVGFNEKFETTKLVTSDPVVVGIIGQIDNAILSAMTPELKAFEFKRKAWMPEKRPEDQKEPELMTLFEVKAKINYLTLRFYNKNSKSFICTSRDIPLTKEKWNQYLTEFKKGSATDKTLSTVLSTIYGKNVRCFDDISEENRYELVEKKEIKNSLDLYKFTQVVVGLSKLMVKTKERSSLYNIYVNGGCVEDKLLSDDEWIRQQAEEEEDNQEFDV